MPLKILLVEDDVPTLELMWEILTSLGVEVRPVGDSQEAATLVTKEKFDGVFLDQVMPKVDGFELARRIRESPSNSRTPIVVVTGRRDKQTIDQAFAAGATFFLEKPVDRQKLTHLLDSTRGSMLEERRRYKRIPLLTPITCQIESRELQGRSVNLSQSGLFCELGGALTRGEVVEVRFQLPGQAATIQTRTVVVRVDEKRRVGLRFVDMAPENRQQIRDLISSQLDAA